MSDPLRFPRAAERSHPEPPPAPILLAGFDAGDGEEVRELLGPDLELLVAESREAALALLGSRSFAVFCLGGRFTGPDALRLVEEGVAKVGEPEGPAPLNIVLSAGPDPTLFQDLIADDRIFYLTQRPPEAGELAALLKNALLLYRSQLERSLGAKSGGSREPLDRLDLVEVLRRLALQPKPLERAEVLAEAAEEALAAERAYCLLYDAADETLWAKDPTTGSERRESAAVGLTSFVLRSGLPVVLRRAGSDPRYDREADDPLGVGTEHFVAVPVLTEGGRPVAVVAAVRGEAAAEFTDDDRQALERLTALAAPYFAPPPAPGGPGENLTGLYGTLFRREAVDGYQVADTQQDPLMISPAWTRWSYWILLAALVAGLAYSLIGQVHEYATGLAVVWIGGRNDVTASVAGTVSAVDVVPGQDVKAGQVLARLYESQEAAELAQIEQEFTLQLINRLRDPTDASAEQALLGLRTQRELARSRLQERTLRAPADGKVSDVRVRPGQYLTPGQLAVSIGHEEARPTLVVLVPGQYRPSVKPGLPIRLEIAGYKYAYQKLAVESVSDEVIGPTEARRYLGPEIADSVAIEGPVAIVKARLPASEFTADGKTYRYHNGMHGTAEVQVRSERLLLTLVPGLKALFRAKGDLL